VITDYTAAKQLKLRPKSYGQMFANRVAESGPREAFRYPRNGSWESLSWNGTRDRVHRIAAGLIKLGVRPQDRVAIASSTRLEWVLADLGIMCAAAATTTIYPSTSTEDFTYILADSGSRVLIAEDLPQANKALQNLDLLPELFRVVLINGDTRQGTADFVITLDELETIGAAELLARPELVDDTIAAVLPGDLATLIYTSGTTGRPKGVRLAHDSWCYTARAVELLDLLGPDDVHYLWLPLSHVFGKVLIGVQLKIGFVTAVDGNLDRLVDNLAAIQPTFEKVRARVTAAAVKDAGLKTKVFSRAMETAIKYQATLEAGSVSRWQKVKHGIADRFVLRQIRQRLGGNIRFFISGSAALSPPVAEWFRAVGMPIVQGYGLTESSAASCLNPPGRNVLGTVGPPLPGTRIKLGDDGEIMIKGPGVMLGYHNLPTVTAEVLDNDGWFATGDIGELTGDGYLRITDRKKDLIKTSNGKFVAPQKIEILFQAISPQTSHILVHGEGRSYITALITLDPDAVHDWVDGTSAPGQTGPFSDNPLLRNLIQEQINTLNNKLERWETIKKFLILDEQLTVEDGALTPSMKVRRKNVESKHQNLLDQLYTD